MTDPQKITLLSTWLDSFNQIKAVYESLESLTLAAPESPLARALYDTHSRYTETLSQLLGDTDGSLEWFLLENDAGKNGMGVQLAHWDAPRPIRILEDLLSILPVKNPTATQ